MSLLDISCQLALGTLDSILPGPCFEFRQWGGGGGGLAGEERWLMQDMLTAISMSFDVRSPSSSECTHANIPLNVTLGVFS